jgi:hypothetical protein
MKSVRRGGADFAAASPLARPAARDPQQPSDPRASANQPRDDRLTYLHVTFQRNVTGNIHHRQVQLHQDVHAVYGKVDAWNKTLSADDVGPGQPGMVVLTSDMLQVAEVGDAVDGRAPVELQALGNALVEGQTFTARAHRIAYAQAKDMLLIEGDGRSDAELFRQAQVGGATGRAAARKIIYWPRTGRMDVDTFNSLDWAGPLGPADSPRTMPEGVGQYLRSEQESRQPASSTPPR